MFFTVIDLNKVFLRLYYKIVINVLFIIVMNTGINFSVY